MICPRYGSSVCGPHCSLVTAEIFAMYTQSEPSFMSFCPVASRLSEWIVDDESLRDSPLKTEWWPGFLPQTFAALMSCST